MKTYKLIIGTALLATAVGVGANYGVEIKGCANESRDAAYELLGKNTPKQQPPDQNQQSPQSPENQESGKTAQRKQQYQVQPPAKTGSPDTGSPDRLRKIEELTDNLIDEMTRLGEDTAQGVYQGMQEDITSTIDKVQKNMCQPSLSGLAQEWDKVTNRYLSEENAAVRYSSGTIDTLAKLPHDDYQNLAQVVNDNMPEDVRADLIKKEGLDVWLQRLEKTFGVNFRNGTTE